MPKGYLAVVTFTVSWVYVPAFSWVSLGMGMVEAGAAMKDELDKSCGVWECVWGLAGCMYCRVCRSWGHHRHGDAPLPDHVDNDGDDEEDLGG